MQRVYSRDIRDNFSINILAQFILAFFVFCYHVPFSTRVSFLFSSPRGVCVYAASSSCCLYDLSLEELWASFFELEVALSLP